IHVWPAQWDLASFDTECLSAILYLQFAFPGRFTIVEECNPDLSPSGQLPYLTHAEQTVAPLTSIISYLSSLTPESIYSNLEEEPFEIVPSLDGSLSSADKQQVMVWREFVGAKVGDLVAHSFYAFWPNYSTMMQPLLVSVLPFPQKFYVPDRLRSAYKPRLDAGTYWEEEEEETEDERKRLSAETTAGKWASILKPKQAFRRALGKSRTLEKARETFDLLTRLLGEQTLFFGDRPSTLDIILAAHILPVLRAPLPDPFLKTLLLESYSHLVSHACHISAIAFP
ncbi:hypothetical protein DL93DRAFT_2028552, partial [Clavulina sp. PMI_390]